MAGSCLSIRSSPKWRQTRRNRTVLWGIDGLMTYIGLVVVPTYTKLLSYCRRCENSFCYFINIIDIRRYSAYCTYTRFPSLFYVNAFRNFNFDTKKEDGRLNTKCPTIWPRATKWVYVIYILCYQHLIVGSHACFVFFIKNLCFFRLTVAIGENASRI